ncbi:hypothetical protein [Thiomicrorhabdus sp. Milos-T2]|uniref:hypothetical protein n=1 Tax=Thiomicrorhabdus sp. Milos-T2 TaxID=90814 RepID=UPI000494032C|nr:hypothetical protein [Thiomicrorhabdus sp. Milos-T2]
MDNLISEKTTGKFVELKNERYYLIENIDSMPNFFMSIVSHSDHWLFISSNTGLTAGRVSSDSALFPYAAVDKIQDSAEHSGNKTILRVKSKDSTDSKDSWVIWEPFKPLTTQQKDLKRNLYKHVLGNKICFEEFNETLNMTFRFTWNVSDEFGFVVESEIINHSTQTLELEVMDGLQNILPASVPTEVQTNASNLVDAYRFNEQEHETGVAIFSLYSGITDKPEPVEVLKANTAFQIGLDNPQILLSSRQINAFTSGKDLQPEETIRGIRGAYFVISSLQLQPGCNKEWKIIANVEQNQTEIVQLISRLKQNPTLLNQELEKTIKSGSEKLKDLISQADGHQLTGSEMDDVHHYSNVLFNSMRGGVFDDQYWINSSEFAKNIEHFNKVIFEEHANFFTGLPKQISLLELREKIALENNSQLERLCSDYLPITFGRRHGDPSRPWNRFSINIKDNSGNRILAYEGNWRDIFQNWEALLLSYPEFIENVISKFVNSSTIDGYNPYRITNKGIDWEIEDPKDPWSYIGYWGDHQIIYLLKLLELSNKYHPKKLAEMLSKSIYSYANVPYRIASFDKLLLDPKNTVKYDEDEEQLIQKRIKSMGADGKLVLNSNGDVYQVNLLEKLLVPLLSKLSNFVLRGGIWLNTQRPEWNDANNALVGQGLSMVTLYYMRRYVDFLQQILQTQQNQAACSTEVVTWFLETANSIEQACKHLNEHGEFSDAYRFEMLSSLGQSASAYRQKIYKSKCFSGKTELDINHLKSMLSNVTTLLDDSIKYNQRTDNLYHAYNILSIEKQSLSVDYLYAMLEGQVSVLSSGTLEKNDVITLLKSLFKSDLFREDQKTFMLYPDEPQKPFLQKNSISLAQIDEDKNLSQLVKVNDQIIIVKDDILQIYRFHHEIINLEILNNKLDSLKTQLGTQFEIVKLAVVNLYKDIFNHKEFTGRSHGMFGFEGLGCIYWHMVSKLLLATQESFFHAIATHASTNEITELGQLYYRIREGIGFNKTPAEYGAFPYDPYSHTPKHSGAQQPGMTGQVKEEVLTRFGELGIQIKNGIVHFATDLLRKTEFNSAQNNFEYLAVSGKRQNLMLPENSIAFTVCQTPIIYKLVNKDSYLVIKWSDGRLETRDELNLSVQESEEIFKRTNKIISLEVGLDESKFNF